MRGSQLSVMSAAPAAAMPMPTGLRAAAEVMPSVAKPAVRAGSAASSVPTASSKGPVAGDGHAHDELLGAGRECRKAATQPLDAVGQPFGEAG